LQADANIESVCVGEMFVGRHGKALAPGLACEALHGPDQRAPDA
jgi:hypothetical protein